MENKHEDGYKQERTMTLNVRKRNNGEELSHIYPDPSFGLNVIFIITMNFRNLLNPR